MSGKGAAAKRVFDIMKQIMHREDWEEKVQKNKNKSQPNEANKVRAQINKLILIDRFIVHMYNLSDVLSISSTYLDLPTSSLHFPPN